VDSAAWAKHVISGGQHHIANHVAGNIAGAAGVGRGWLGISTVGQAAQLLDSLSSRATNRYTLNAATLTITPIWRTYGKPT